MPKNAIEWKIGNVPVTVDGDKLIVEIDLSAKGVASASGKSVILASTRGNKPVPGPRGAVLSVNCYIPNE